MGFPAIVIQTFTRWNNHDGQRLGAALAFYTLLSTAPLLLFLLLAAAALYGKDAAEREIIEYVGNLAGNTAARLTQTFLSGAYRPAHQTLASVFAAGTLLFGASGVFTELRYDLNKMWEARPPGTGVLAFLVQQAFAFLLVLAAGAVFFALILLSALASFLTRVFNWAIHVPALVAGAADFAVSFAVLTLIFVLIYRFVPDVVLSWRVLWVGAAVTAALFVVTKMLLALYIGRAGFGSAYGAAGSVIAVALWAYFSAQIFLLCAEFTYLWSQRGVAIRQSSRLPLIIPRRTSPS